VNWADRLTRVFSFRRISGQIAALILTSLVLIHVLIAGFFLIGRPEPQMLTDEPTQQSALIARIMARTPANDRRQLLKNIDRALPNLELRLTDKDSPAVTQTTLPRISIPSPFEGKVELVQRPLPEKESMLFYLADGSVLEAVVAAPRLPGFVTGLWASTLLFLVISITLLGVWAGRALGAPLSAFARAAESFTANRLSDPLPETGPEEIRSAARALNAMRDRITSLMNDRTRMLAAISHDLRTPITRLRLRSEFIEDEAQRAQILRDLDQMQSMLESVLTLLRNGNAAKPTLVDVAGLVQLVCEEFSDCGQSVTYHGPKRQKLVVRPDEIKRAITNLVENAVRYGTEVEVNLVEHDETVTIDISDNGPGIPDDKKAAMLEPFVRGDEARTMDEGSGFGLGLSIAQAIVQGHGGSLSLHDNKPQGLRVTASLPRPAPMTPQNRSDSLSR
jgi:signal transduction histidine kinase